VFGCVSVNIFDMRMDFTIWISEEVLVLYFREERCLMMFRGLHSLVFNLFMWVDQLYLLFIVIPRIVVLLVSGIFTEEQIK